MGTRDRLLAAVGNLNVWQQGSRRAPHKPLLLLIALGRIQRGLPRLAGFEEATAELLPLLRRYAPPVKAKHQPELPYWHLQGDGIWEVPGGSELPRQKGGFPRMGPLRGTSAGLKPEFFNLLAGDPRLVAEVGIHLLDAHFPETLTAAVAAGASFEAEAVRFESSRRRKRDAAFPREVLRAYEHQCAVTGFRAALDGTYLGVEAAHVRAHCYDGPSIVANGMVLTPTLHRLFDHGAWSLTDDRRVLVSSKFTGSDEATVLLRAHHGRALREPLPGDEPVAPEYIRWHREPDFGGIFREPALPLAG